MAAGVVAAGGGGGERYAAWLGEKAAAAGVQSGQLLQGKLMVSQHRPEEAWVRAPAGAADLFLPNRAHRGRAIYGDTVRPGF